MKNGMVCESLTGATLAGPLLTALVMVFEVTVAFFLSRLFHRKKRGFRMLMIAGKSSNPPNMFMVRMMSSW